MANASSPKGVLVYGGSFNPIHIGHLRLAIEARECLRSFLSRIHFVPAYSHPWKDDGSLLPFTLRVKLVRAAIECLPGAFCSELEEEREGPSYTIDTLGEYCKNYKKENVFFLIGSEDYLLLPKWRRGLEIIKFCNLAVAPRGAWPASDFIEATRRFWSGAVPDLEAQNQMGLDKGVCLRTASGSRVFYLSIPWLEISGSRIRRLWLDGYNIDFLVPWADIEILDKEKTQVREIWLKKN